MDNLQLGASRILRWCVSLIALCVVLPVSAQRATYDFNRDWRLHVGDVIGAEGETLDDAAWKPVTLPRAWNEDHAFRVSSEDLPTGIAWYRKRFVLPPGSEGKKIYLELEGARQGAEIFLNGKSIGLHEDGITAVGFDLTVSVRPAPAVNVLSIRTDNAWDYRERSSGEPYQWNLATFNASWGGLSKSARLHVTDRLHQTLPLYPGLGTVGVYVYARDFDLVGGVATIHAESEVRNDRATTQTFRYEVVVTERDGRVVSMFRGPDSITLAPGAVGVARASARVSGLQWWSWGYGHLYDVTTRLHVDDEIVDSVLTRTGFRQIRFKDGMVELNGRVLQIKGYAQRSTNEWPAIGQSVPAWLSDFSNNLMVESNANLVRWMHVAPWRQDVESCDRVGLLQSVPAGDAEKDVVGRQWSQRAEVMRATIIACRNNPSVVFYESGNNGISEQHMSEMRALRDRYDPYGGRAAGSRDMLGSCAAEFGGEMLNVNKSAGKPMWAMEYSRDEGARKFWDEFSPPYHKNGDGPLHRGQSGRSWNHNQDSHAIENVRRWYDYWRERPGTSSRVNAGGVNIIFSDSNTHYRGAENFRRSGEVDAMRLTKDGFYAHQVMWDGWVDVERARTHLLGHWNYTAGITKPVYVISSADVVELRLNGKSLGRIDNPEYRFLFTFPNIAWHPGVLEAIGYDRAGKELCRDFRETAGPGVALRLTSRVAPDDLGFKADGADLALLEVEAVDAQGRRVPTALDEVSFNVEGPAEWRGGIAQGPNNYILSSLLPLQCGINRALLRSTAIAGTITVRASAAGLKSAELRLKSVATPPAASPGVHALASADRLVVQPSRGPTPVGAAYRVSRRSIPVESVRAGSNAGAAPLAYDDNEASTWYSSEESGAAWIEFTLSRAATISDITARLAGWRSRRYPLRIMVDGQVVYDDITTSSLGYTTLPLRPVRGRIVRVELSGQGQADGRFSTITEVANAANNPDRATQSERKLGLIEIEFHEAVTE